MLGALLLMSAAVGIEASSCLVSRADGHNPSMCQERYDGNWARDYDCCAVENDVRCQGAGYTLVWSDDEPCFRWGCDTIARSYRCIPNASITCEGHVSAYPHYADESFECDSPWANSWIRYSGLILGVGIPGLCFLGSGIVGLIMMRKSKERRRLRLQQQQANVGVAVQTAPTTASNFTGQSYGQAPRYGAATGLPMATATAVPVAVAVPVASS